MAYIAAEVNENVLRDNATHTDAAGHHECVIFIQNVTSAPNTRIWKKGRNVLESVPGSIRRGTAIATFDGNTYPSINRHAALYLSHDTNGIWVFDQWKKQGMVKKRYIHKKPIVDISVNNAIRYFVID